MYYILTLKNNKPISLSGPNSYEESVDKVKEILKNNGIIESTEISNWGYKDLTETIEIAAGWDLPDNSSIHIIKVTD